MNKSFYNSALICLLLFFGGFGFPLQSGPSKKTETSKNKTENKVARASAIITDKVALKNFGSIRFGMT
ncbi:MAG: hypothetical protein SFU25_05110, partial [Candidatus Caenarcaniphilales bacterium]|nr:hypothetical protein [Candidatus Caenarcaniphilales bacterium]